MPQLSPQSSVTNSERIHGNVEVFPLLNTAADSPNVRENLINRCLLIGRIAKFAIPYSLIDHKLYVGLCLATLALVFINARLSDELIRIGLIRKHQNFYFKIL